MLVAHAPAGYIIAKKMKNKEKSLIIASMIFAVLPDVDLIYYYLFDKTKTFHHLYFTHLPIVLLGSFLVLQMLLMMLPKDGFEKKFKPYFYLFYINWFVHLLLDTVTGGIAWLYPFNAEVIKLIKIPEISRGL